VTYDDNRGYFKIYRKIFDSAVGMNVNLFYVFQWCVCRANYKDQWVSVRTGRGTTPVFVKRGQFIYGRKKDSQRTGLSPSLLRNCMAKLKKLGNLDIQSDTHYSIVTICNYETYQGSNRCEGQATGQPKDNQRTTKGQPKDTENKYKKDNKVNKGEEYPEDFMRRRPKSLYTTPELEAQGLEPA
jgi:hypothetical protein